MNLERITSAIDETNDSTAKECLRHLCRSFFEFIGASVSNEGELLRIKLPDECQFEWEGKEIVVGFDETIATKADVEPFLPGSKLFHSVYEWLRCRAFHVAVKLPELKKPREPKLRLVACKVLSVVRKKVNLRGLIVSLSLRCMQGIKWARFRNLLLLENGFFADITEEVDRFLSLANAGERFFDKKLVDKLLKQLKEECEAMFSGWICDAEKAVGERMHIELSRIANYYERLLEELIVKADDKSVWQELNKLVAERNEKMAEEAQRHQLFILAQIVGIAEVTLPAVEFKIKLKAKSSHPLIKVYFNLHDGSFIFPKCKCCNTRTSQIGVCSNGHITCGKCIAKCVSCGNWFCKDCIKERCQICRMPVCDTCLIFCQICQKPVCKVDIANCEICGRSVCLECISKCDLCGKRVCSEEANRCYICGKAFCKYCVNEDNITVCATCGKIVCKDHAKECAICNQSLCSNCAGSCHLCGKIICRMHAISTACCSATMCNEHAIYCDLCGEAVCPDHIAQCGICGSYICYSCSRVCNVCEQRYCSSCLQGRTMCKLCIRLLQSPEVKLPPSHLPSPLPNLNTSAHICHFTATPYRRFYLWRDNMDGVLVVADSSKRTIFTKRLNALWLLRHLKRKNARY